VFRLCSCTGTAVDARMWDDQVPALADIARVVRYDARGFGSLGPRRGDRLLPRRRPLAPARPPRDRDSIELLGTIAAPTTVVSGELDVPCFREMSDILADKIPAARRITLPGVGHMVNMEAPEPVNSLLREVVLESWPSDDGSGRLPRGQAARTGGQTDE
jgi:hypothetical protein